jgi:hypothetical protein
MSGSCGHVKGRFYRWEANGSKEADAYRNHDRVKGMERTVTANIRSRTREEHRNSSTDDEYRLRRQADDLCVALFDRWCERREITPLTYLLHAWHLFPSKPHPVRRLAATLRDLSMFHAEMLDDMDRELIDNVHAITGYD